MDISIDAIKQLIAALDSSRLDQLDFECKEFKLRLERTPAVGSAVPAAPAAAPAAAKEPPCGDSEEKAGGHMVKAPIVGTYYASASPDKPPFVQVGSHVDKGDTLFIIESMKLMNEITSEWDGTVTKVLLKSGCGVEYGQPVLCIE